MRLLAPAGCGKTLSLLARCAHLASLDSEGARTRFLIFTFTRGARDELIRRVHADVQFQLLRDVVQITTLNSWGFRHVKNQMSGVKLLKDGGLKFTTAQNTLKPVWTRYPLLREHVESRHGNRIKKDMLDKIDLLKQLGFRHDQHNTQDSFGQHVAWLFANGMARQLAPLARDLSKVWRILPDQADFIELLRAIGTDVEPDVADSSRMIETFVQLAWAGFGEFWCEASKLLGESALLTLEDQKYHALITLEAAIRTGQLSTGMHRVHHILVDEFQDINVLDLNLLSAIAKYHKAELTIVGDDDQAIFEWRGAYPGFILEPEKFIAPAYDTYTLSVNYRSPANVVEHSQRLIKHNRRRVDKDIRASSTARAEITLLRTAALPDAVSQVVDSALELLKEGEGDRIALISRKRSQLIPYQIIFAEKEIPFYAAEDLSVFLSDAFHGLRKALVSRLHARTPRPGGYGVAADVCSLVDQVLKYKMSRDLRDRLTKHISRQRPETLMDGVNELSMFSGKFAYDQTAADIVTPMLKFLATETVEDCIAALSGFEGMQKDYGKSLEDIFHVDPPFLYLSKFATSYGSDFQRFDVALQRAEETLAHTWDGTDEGDSEGQSPQEPPRLHLMTALRAKGKEYDHVFVLDCNDGIWPIKYAETESDLEAERRLFYVAMTRAKRSLRFVTSDVLAGIAGGLSPYLAEAGFSFA